MSVGVLIVDDQRPFREAARAVIEATDGFQVVGECDSGEASIEAVARLHPDLVLMDIHLPGIDGLEATRRILEASKRVTVFLHSTDEEPEKLSQAAACGASAYISKARLDPQRLAATWASLQEDRPGDRPGRSLSAKSRGPGA